LELGRTYSAHHVGLEILAESGLVGIATFGLFLLLYLREAWRLRLTLGTGRPGLAAGYLVFAVVSSIAMLYGGYAYGGYTEVGRLYFVVVGLTLAQGDLLRQAP
jgi:O-antigen ligase